MHAGPSFVAIAALALVTIGAAPIPAQDAPVDRLVAAVEHSIQTGHVVGAQLVVAHDAETVLVKSLGLRDVGSAVPVDDETMFCIGSCSKAFASAVILALVADGAFELDDGVDEWLPAFATAKVRSTRGEPVDARRAPTIRELAGHRAGIFGQGEEPTPQMMATIRNFELSLERSVDTIATFPLSYQPGRQFVYSGAGYCVLGRAAELAGELPFEELLQRELAEPLGLRRTTYFPPPSEENIAMSYRLDDDGESIPNHRAPHRLGERLKLPLIGGSLYSTARECAAFASMIANRGSRGDRTVLPPELWKEILRRPERGRPYALGWNQMPPSAERGDPVTRLAHTGSLHGFRCVIEIDLESRSWVVCLLSTRVGPRPGGEFLVRAIFGACRDALTAPR